MTERDLRGALQRELDELVRLRDELKVRLHLAKADAKDEWHELEAKLGRVTAELARTAENAKAPAEQLGDAARSMLDELRRSYERIKAELRI